MGTLHEVNHFNFSESIQHLYLKYGMKRGHIRRLIDGGREAGEEKMGIN